MRRDPPTGRARAGRRRDGRAARRWRDVREAVSRLPPAGAGLRAGRRAERPGRGRHRAARSSTPTCRCRPSREAVLAWGVREATTNVIRHSAARHCAIRIAGGRRRGDAGGDRRRLRGARRRRPRRVRAARAGRARRGGRRAHGRRTAAAGRLRPAAAGAARRAGMIRVLIAEDQSMVRGALAALLALEPDIEVVAQVARGDEVVARGPGATRPTWPCWTSRCPARDGLEAAAALARELPAVRALVLTTFGRPGYLRRAMEEGAAGFLLKTAPVEQLAVAIRARAAGERVVDPDLAVAALSEGDSPLTDREREVLRRRARRRHRRRAGPAAAPLAGDGAQLPVVGDGQARARTRAPRRCAWPRTRAGCRPARARPARRGPSAAAPRRPGRRPRAWTVPRVCRAPP